MPADLTIPDDLPRSVPCGGCSGGVATLWHWQYHNGLTTYRCDRCGWKTRDYASDLIDGTERHDDCACPPTDHIPPCPLSAH